MSPLAGREIGFASLSDFMRGQYLRTEFVWEQSFAYARTVWIARALLVGSLFRFYSLLYILLCTLVIEGLRPSNSSQAFREKLDQKLSSLAF